MLKPSHVLGVLLLAAATGSCGGSGGAQSGADGATDHGPAGDGQADSNATETSPDAGTDGGAVITPQLCSDTCQVQLQIVCPDQPTMADCVSTCLSEASVCTAQGMALDECLVTNGPQALECDQLVQSVVVKDDGPCGQESADVVTCLQM